MRPLVVIALSLTVFAQTNMPVRIYSIGVSAEHPSIPANPEIASLIEELFQTTSAANVPEESVSFLAGPFARASFIKKFAARTINADGIVILYLNTYATSGGLIAASDSSLSNAASFLPIPDLFSFSPRALVLLLDTPASNAAPLLPASDASFAAACSSALGRMPHCIVRNIGEPNGIMKNLVNNFRMRAGTDTKGIDGIVTAGEVISALPKSDIAANTLGDLSNVSVASYTWSGGSISLTTNRLPPRRAVLTRNFIVYKRQVSTNADGTYTVSTNRSAGQWK